MTHRHRVEVRQEDADDEKLKSSRWLMTINSNVVTPSMKDPYVRKFKRQINRILEDIPQYIVPNKGFPPDPAMIVTCKPYLEIGPAQKRLHAHISVHVQHDSNVRIDCRAISEALGGMYVNVHHVKAENELRRILDYIRKQS